MVREVPLRQQRSLVLSFRLGEADHLHVPEGMVLRLAAEDCMAVTKFTAENSLLGMAALAIKEGKPKDKGKVAEKNCMLAVDSSLEVGHRGEVEKLPRGIPLE